MTDTSQQERKTSGRQANLGSADPYAVLGLERRAALSEVKRAYFELVRQYSPETNPDAFKLIRAAYEKLNSAESKTETDLFLFQPPPPWEARKRRRKMELDFDPQDIWLLLQTYGDLGRSRFDEDFRSLRDSPGSGTGAGDSR
jgi:curved DNA-binding protein CbpA